MLALTPIVETPRESLPFWCALPPKPWPSFVELSRLSTDGEVGLVLLQLATYNRQGHGTPLSPADLAKAESLVLPGGLKASANARTVLPSCCSGLEDWTEWRIAAVNGSSPWMGHDPSPWLEKQEGFFYLWPDEAPLEQRDQLSIRFTQAELEEQLRLVSEMLLGFHARLREVLTAFTPTNSDALASMFERTFVQAGTSEA
jgi:hypothetical protein